MPSRLLILFLLAPLVSAACSPSLAYREGHGFYSEQLTQAQVEQAIQAGTVTKAGRITIESSDCGLYSERAADEALIVVPLKEKLREMGANAATHVSATERPVFILLSFITLPMGCADWTIRGEAWLVDGQGIPSGPASRSGP
ncbi:MAG: hypothetical protein AB1411_15855 [Nitrospirota bacterium]